MGDGVWMELLARDSVLADVKLIGCGYDMGGIARKLGGKKRLAACHSGFQSVMRRFLRGDEDQVNGFLYYTRENPQDHGEVHYLANHDGFTLADMTVMIPVIIWRTVRKTGTAVRIITAGTVVWKADKKNVDSGTSKKTDEECHAAVVFVTGDSVVIRR